MELPMPALSKPADPALSQSWFLAIALPLAVVAAYLVMISVAPRDAIPWLHEETGPVEVATALVFLAATILSMVMAIRIKKVDPARPTYIVAAYVLVSLVSLFMLLEETSYGQHYFGFESPDVFQEHNKQQETNLHNLWNDAPSSTLRNIANIALPMLGIVLPLIITLRPNWNYRRGSWSWYLFPRWELVLWVVLSMLISPIRKFGGWSDGDHIWRGTFSEFKELLWAFTGLVLLIVLYRRIFKIAPRTSADATQAVTATDNTPQSQG
jgi:hypothetical protein